jgi:GTP cyclohydrolase II
MHRPLTNLSSVPAAEADPASNQMRNARRAILDARNGLPVLIAGSSPLVVLAAESATPAGLSEWRAASAGPGVLLLAPTRAAAVLHQPVAPGAAAALALPQGVLDPGALLALADPTQPQGPALATAPVPALAEAALTLAKLGRLLPAVLVAPAAPGLDAGLLHVAAADLLAYPAHAAATAL